jgi:hypothetical protein
LLPGFAGGYALIAIARHFIARSALMAEAGSAVGKYAVRATTINILTVFASFAMDGLIRCSKNCPSSLRKFD